MTYKVNNEKLRIQLEINYLTEVSGKFKRTWCGHVMRDQIFWLKKKCKHDSAVQEKGNWKTRKKLER